jgi:nucleoside-diphosphate-sugar epimerase
MATPILVTGAAGRVGAVGRTVTELLLKQGSAVRAMVRNDDERAQALRDMGAEVVVGDLLRSAPGDFVAGRWRWKCLPCRGAAVPCRARFRAAPFCGEFYGCRFRPC